MQDSWVNIRSMSQSWLYKKYRTSSICEFEQKVHSTQNPDLPLVTSTEIYDYLKLLFARIGKTISPIIR